MIRKRFMNRIASRFNPENCPQFFNKQTLENGITTYWVEESDEGIEAIRNAFDSAWGNRSTRPWWAVEKIDFSTGCKVRAAFGNGKIFAVSWTDEFGLRWWDLMNNETRYLPGAFDAEGYNLEGDWLHAMQDPIVTKDKFFTLDFNNYDYDYDGWWKVVLAYRNSATILKIG